MFEKSWKLAGAVAGLVGLVGTLTAGAGEGIVAPSPEEAKPLAVGEMLPAVPVTNAEGTAVKLTEALEGQPAAIVFYRGHWCPMCMKHLVALQEIEADLKSMGVKLVAVSPDKPAYLVEAKEKAKLNFDLYSDNKLELAKAMGLAFQLDEKTAERYKKNLVKSTGHDSGQLPVPAVFLTNAEGKITYVFSEPDYKVRLSNEDLLAAVKKVQG